MCVADVELVVFVVAGVVVDVEGGERGGERGAERARRGEAIFFRTPE